MIKARRAIENLKPYRPPREGRVGKLRLDFNENTVGCAPEVVRALKKALNRDWLSTYPEYEEGRRKLARTFRVSPEEMLLVNGTDDAIQVVRDTFLEEGDRVLVPAPTFPVYRLFAEAAGARVQSIRYREDFSFPMEEFFAALRRGPKWVALANPNNPTGTLVTKPQLRKMLQAAPSTLFLIDEAYYEFSGQTVLPWVRRTRNLIVTRTFSKAFGLAALRMGCLFAHKSLADLMRRGQNPFAVNSLALACATEAVKHSGWVKGYVREVLANRKIFCAALDRMNVAYVPSSSNFVLTRIGPNSSRIADRLRRKKILVRDWTYDPRLKGYLRFTIGSTAQTRLLMKELQAVQNMIGTRQDGRPRRRKT